jgi:hypothetical protein
MIIDPMVSLAMNALSGWTCWSIMQAYWGLPHPWDGSLRMNKVSSSAPENSSSIHTEQPPGYRAPSMPGTAAGVRLQPQPADDTPQAISEVTGSPQNLTMLQVSGHNTIGSVMQKKNTSCYASPSSPLQLVARPSERILCTARRWSACRGLYPRNGKIRTDPHFTERSANSPFRLRGLFSWRSAGATH